MPISRASCPHAVDLLLATGAAAVVIALGAIAAGFAGRASVTPLVSDSALAAPVVAAISNTQQRPVRPSPESLLGGAVPGMVQRGGDRGAVQIQPSEPGSRRNFLLQAGATASGYPWRSSQLYIYGWPISPSYGDMSPAPALADPTPTSQMSLGMNASTELSNSR
jgi:hypothetical protein